MDTAEPAPSLAASQEDSAATSKEVEAQASSVEATTELVELDGPESGPESRKARRARQRLGAEGEPSSAEASDEVRSSEMDTAMPVQQEDPPVARGSRARVLAILLAATVVFAGLATWFGSEWYQLRYTGPAANAALSDPGPTSEVNGQISDAAEKVFSYDFSDTAKSERAVQSLLTGRALDEYNELFTIIKQQAPQQKLVVTTTVKNSAVTWLQGDRARVLLFVDQRGVRTTTGETNTAPAQISIGAEKQGGTWKITDIQLR